MDKQTRPAQEDDIIHISPKSKIAEILTSEAIEVTDSSQHNPSEISNNHGSRHKRMPSEEVSKG